MIVGKIADFICDVKYKKININFYDLRFESYLPKILIDNGFNINRKITKFNIYETDSLCCMQKYTLIEKIKDVISRWWTKQKLSIN